MTSAAIYCRVSNDDDGRSRSVDQQEAECRAYCDSAGWEIAEVVVDSDISASRYSKRRRPGWARILKLVEDRAVDALVAWDLDRMLRQPKELEHLIDLADQGLPVVTLGGGDVNLATPDGRFIARILVAKAAKESDDISRRTRRAKAAKAARGEPARVANLRAFGWVDGLTPDVEQAELIRESARRVLAGEVSLVGLAREWSDAGWLPPRGGQRWTATTVRHVLTSRRNAGLLQHRGEVVGEAPWPAILDRVTHERLRAMAAANARGASPHRRGPWTGVFVCGGCGHGLWFNGPKSRRFRCVTVPAMGRCGRISIVAEPAQAWVLDRVFAWVDLAGPPPVLVDDGPSDALVVAELADIEERLSGLAEDYGAGRVSRGQFVVASERLLERRERLVSVAGDVGGSGVVAPFLGRPGALREAWPALSAADQNRVLRAVVSVTVGPGWRCVFDPARLDVRWLA